MTVDEYILAQSEEIRPLLISVRNTICTALPEAEERFSWQMPTYWRNHNLIHFAAQKKHLGIYPGAAAVVVFKPLLDEHKLKYSKGAIKFPYDKVDLELIKTISEWCGRNNCG